MGQEQRTAEVPIQVASQSNSRSKIKGVIIFFIFVIYVDL